jgi:hypothetical protein
MAPDERFSPRMLKAVELAETDPHPDRIFDAIRLLPQRVNAQLEKVNSFNDIGLVVSDWCPKQGSGPAKPA